MQMIASTIGQYTLVNDKLYRRGANDTLMKCITLEEIQIILQDIHTGVCGSHICAKSLVGKTYWQGFFWLTTVYDADSIVHQCEVCQIFTCQKHVPSHQLQTIPINWPFLTWGLDLVGLLKEAKVGFTHIFITVDKCTKWVEVKPVVSITAAMAVEFISKIMYMFGVPNNIITDYGTQFTAREFKDFCADSGIKINYASVSHTQSNG
jgi:hypothetical protein